MQLNVILPNMLQNDSLALVCMIAVALLFIPNPICAVFIAAAIVTIDIGWSFARRHSSRRHRVSVVVGRKAGPDLHDHHHHVHRFLHRVFRFVAEVAGGICLPAAHITHAYVSASGSLTPHERCVDAMEKLAFPSWSPGGGGEGLAVMNGSLSTILGVTVLAFINSYMVLVFFKVRQGRGEQVQTIFLVLVFGVLHALVLLPVVLATTSPLIDRFNHRHEKRFHPVPLVEASEKRPPSTQCMPLHYR